MNLKTRLGCSAAFLAAMAGIAWGAGNWSTLPVVGGSSFCASTVTGTGNLGGITGQGQGTIGSICAQTVPAGPPAVTGIELIPADTQLAGGAPPQTVVITSDVLVRYGQGAERNILIGSDFQTNLWQRGTTPLSAASPTTTTMSADRWGVYSSGNVVTVTKDVTAADVAPALGVNGIMKVTRPSGTNTSSICVGQVMPAAESARFIGKEAIFSFFGEALAGYLQTGGTIIPTIAVYTAADSATPGTNTDAFFKGTITGYTVLNPSTGVSSIAAPVLSGTTAAAVLPLTTSLVRYSTAAYVPPQVNVSGTLTNVVGIGVTLCTGVYPASTGVATDGFAFGNAQLEAASPGVFTSNSSVPAGTSPGSYARRLPADEAVEQYTYTSPGGLGTEVATAFYMAGGCQASGNANFAAVFSPPLRIAPTGATSTLTAGGYSIKTAAAVTAIGTITVVAPTKIGATVNSNAACTSTLPYQIVGSSTTGLILFSAEP